MRAESAGLVSPIYNTEPPVTRENDPSDGKTTVTNLADREQVIREVNDELDACDTEAERVKTQMKAIAKRRKKAKGRLKAVGMKAKNFDAARACSKLPPDVRDVDDQEIVYIRKVLDCSPQADLFATVQ